MSVAMVWVKKDVFETRLICLAFSVAFSSHLFRMYRRTRTGKQFSPFEGFLPVDPSNIDRSLFQIHQLDVSLEELFATAEEAAEKHAETLEDAVIDSDESDAHDDKHIEDSPLQDVTSTPPSGADRQRIRKSEYNEKRRQEKRRIPASSPFARTPHPKPLPTHRLLPSKTFTFNAVNFQTSGGGAWLGVRHSDPPSTAHQDAKRKKGAKKPKKAALKPRRLRTADKLVNEMAYAYTSWDGKNPLPILDLESLWSSRSRARLKTANDLEAGPPRLYTSSLPGKVFNNSHATSFCGHQCRLLFGLATGFWVCPCPGAAFWVHCVSLEIMARRGRARLASSKAGSRQAVPGGPS
ncbi:hypothetical protein B0H16DRAFT_1449894 [Mycena metata]|uniref:Uncharacterized protein n=1 Tax=Mycena metata TaxID=1033252 RepID=A0AAD7NV91_9AGAR|nr:hypothetical protein B0H16DRAFT_1449894 [Mycena metata]